MVLSSGGYLLTRRSKKYIRLRDVSLSASVIIIGLYLSSPFSILHVFNLVLLRPSSAVLWYVIVITTMISVAIAGRFYCGWLCPFGALSEFIGRLTRVKWTIPVKQDDQWRKLKYYLLGAVVIIVFLTQRADYGNYETYITLFSFHGNALTWTLVFLAIVANLRIERFWCRYLCPVAALTGVLSRRAKGYPSRHDCPMANKPDPEISECIRCNRCYNPRE
jgi:polyferredoxin